MEMSPNTVSSAPLPWSLWLLIFLTPVGRATGSAPASDASPPPNSTLLFDGGAPGHNLWNCSCSAPVQDCSEAQAGARCRCHAVLRSALPPAGLRAPGRLTVWVKEPWVLEELLNGSAVGHLRLAFCGLKPMDSRYVALLGLQTLRIHSAVPGAPYPDQEITVSPSAGLAAELRALPFDLSSSSSFHMTFLDVAALSGLSRLKAYTVVGPPTRTLSQHFPHLAPPSSATPDDPADPGDPAAEQNQLVTFVY